MNTHKRIVPIVILAAVAALVTLWLSGTGPAWAESPVSPVSPLPTPCDEECQCLHECIVVQKMRPEVCYGNCVPFHSPLPPRPKPDQPPAPAPVPAPVQQGCPDWWEELDPWMGIYVLRHLDGQYCIGSLVQQP